MRGLILDNLTDNIFTTKKVKTEEATKKEVEKRIISLCKKCKIEITDGRFEFYALETC